LKQASGTDSVGPGDRLGDFTIVRRIGEGGMGVVYLARDERLGRQVALKVIAPRLADDPEFKKRFETEARSAAAIEHPNAVAIYSAGSLGGELYMAMRFVEGVDLRQLLAERGPLEPEIAVSILGDVAGALDSAHRAGLVHRDIKPGNVLLAKGEDGSAYLTDFGLTRGQHGGSEQLTGTGQWIGTLDYVAPEQMASERVDARTDVYALGCVFYEMLAGEVPFPGNDMQKVMAKANQAVPGLPGERGVFDPVIARATARDPEQRHRSAGDLARDARAALAGEKPQLTERGVATGAAAAGMLEFAPTEPATAPTRLAAKPPRADPPTRRLPHEEDARERHGSGARTAAIIGGAVVLAAGLIAGALIFSGRGGSDSRTVVNRATTTVAEPTADREPADSAEAEATSSQSTADTTPGEFQTAGYRVAMPAGWTQTESEEIARDGSFVENKWASPAGDEEILIDESVGAPSPPAESAEAIRADLESAEEPIYAARDDVFKGGAYGSEIDFQASSDLRERADFFFDRGGSGFALLASAEDQATARSLVGPAVASLEASG
jgi:serine/threonine protein kinase